MTCIVTTETQSGVTHNATVHVSVFQGTCPTPWAPWDSVPLSAAAGALRTVTDAPCCWFYFVSLWHALFLCKDLILVQMYRWFWYKVPAVVKKWTLWRDCLRFPQISPLYRRDIWHLQQFRSRVCGSCKYLVLFSEFMSLVSFVSVKYFLVVVEFFLHLFLWKNHTLQTVWLYTHPNGMVWLVRAASFK